jgi:elongation factor G
MLSWLRKGFPILSRSFSESSKVRNIGISAHIDSGKTTFSERVLFYTGKIKEIHEVKGNDRVGAKMDSMDLERERGITIQSAATFCKWKEWEINLIDTPGHVDFTIEVERALRVLDSAILLVCGASGVQSQTLTVDRQMRRYGVPRITFINKLDRAGANHNIVISAIQKRLPIPSAAIQIPIGLEQNFEGIIDLIKKKAYYFLGPYGNDIQEKEVPQKFVQEMESRREKLIETLAELDEPFAEKFIGGEDILEEDIHSAIRRTTILQKFSPIMLGSAFKNKGVQLVLDAIGKYLPSPSEVPNHALDLSNKEAKVELHNDSKKPLVCLAFKLEENRYGQLTYTRVYQGKIKRGDFIVNSNGHKKVKVSRMVRMHANEMVEISETEAGDICALFGVECSSGDTFTDGSINYAMTSMFIPEPVMSLSIKPTKKEYNNKFAKALTKFQKEDPTFKVKQDEESGETIISGMGELHLQIYAERARREFEIDVELGQPTVNYRETITKRADFDYLHKKQTGGSGQYAGVIGYVEPIPGLKPNEYVPCKFINKTTGMNISPEYISAVEKGFKMCVKKGPQIGYPIVNMQYILLDGSTHIVDSNTNAFITATKGSFRQCFPNADPVILEPVMTIEVNIPYEFQTQVISGLIKRRAVIKDTYRREGGSMALIAEAPLVKMFGYSSEIRSNTQGQGEFTMEFNRMEPVDYAEAENLRHSFKTKEKDDNMD